MSGSVALDANLASAGGDWQRVTVNLHADAHLYVNQPQTLAGLTMSDYSKVTVATGQTSAGGNLLDLGSLSVDNNAALDLGDSDMILRSGDAAGLAMIGGQIARAYAGGTWSGAAGLTSSTVARADVTAAAAPAGTKPVMALGCALNDGSISADHATPLATFDGVSIGSTDVLVKYTLAGDGNLDGYVGFVRDTGASDSYRSDATSPTWSDGDYNYDGQVNDADTTLYANNQSLFLNMSQGNFAPALALTSTSLARLAGQTFSGTLATFTDVQDASATNAARYVATVDWGDGHPQPATVAAGAQAGQFTISAESPTLSDESAPTVIVTVAYAPGSGFEGRGASVAEPLKVIALPAGMSTSAGAGGAIAGQPGAYTLNLASGAIFLDSNVSANSDWQNLQLNLAGSAQAFFNSPQTLGGLSLADSSRAVLAQGSASASGNLLDVGALSIGPAAALDLGDNDMILRGAGAAGRSIIQQQIASAYAGGAWTGAGLTSSAAAAVARAGPTGRTGLAYMLNDGYTSNDGVTPLTQFDGVSVDPSDVLIKYTFLGDADLSGAVDGSDYWYYDTNAGIVSGATWDQADFNYDGAVNSDDEGAIQNNQDKTLGAPAFTRTLTVAPRPLETVPGQPFTGTVGLFTDTQHPLATDATQYTATVDWGDGAGPQPATVAAGAQAGQFTISAASPQPLSSSGQVATITVAYASGSGYAGRAATFSEAVNPITLPYMIRAGDDAVYTLSGSPGALVLDVTAGTVSFDASVAVAGTLWAGLQVNAFGTSRLYFNAAQTLGGLALHDTAEAVATQGGDRLLDLGALTLDPTATLGRRKRVGNQLQVL